MTDLLSASPFESLIWYTEFAGQFQDSALHGEVSRVYSHPCSLSNLSHVERHVTIYINEVSIRASQYIARDTAVPLLHEKKQVDNNPGIAGSFVHEFVHRSSESRRHLLHVLFEC